MVLPRAIGKCEVVAVTEDGVRYGIAPIVASRKSRFASRDLRSAISD